jgi:leader peptidase (prepilin peptidase)/N-methyltransferase
VDPLIAVVVFLFGLSFGSFLNVCIHRLPREQSVVSPGSACPGCGHDIRWYDNVPVLSWLILRGRCRDCGMRITPRYLLVELLVAFVFVGCYAQFDFTLLALKFCVFSFLVVGLIFTDAETKLLPDALTLPGLALGLLFSIFVPVHDLVNQLLPALVSAPAITDSWRLLSLGDAVLGAIVGAAFIFGSGMLYKLARGVEGMGFGDVKLMAMVGAFLGLKLTIFTIFGASIAGAFFGLSAIPAVWIKRTRRRISRHKEAPSVARRRAWESAKKVYRYYAMPFGVFLGSMALVGAFFGNAIFRWYLGRFL